MKTCSYCKTNKKLEEFYLFKTGKRDSWCSQCRRDYRKQYREYNKLYMREYRKKNPDKLKEWRERNKEHLRQYERDEYARNKAAHSRRVKERKLKLKKIEGSHTEQEWQDLLYIYEYKCWYCSKTNIELTKDHIIPISLGGPDNIQNLMPVCRSCNSKKGNKNVDEFFKQQFKEEV